MLALQAELALRRTRRKLELAQAAVNRGKLPAWIEIEGQQRLWQRVYDAYDRSENEPYLAA